jgi:hypothetical protein
VGFVGEVLFEHRHFTAKSKPSAFSGHEKYALTPPFRFALLLRRGAGDGADAAEVKLRLMACEIDCLPDGGKIHGCQDCFIDELHCRAGEAGFGGLNK